MDTRYSQELNNTSFSGLIGVAGREINPPLGIYARNWGAGLTDNATGFHRALNLTCLTFQSCTESKPLVLIGADLGWWKQADEELKFRKAVLDAVGLPETHLMICLSHTHAGPSLSSADAAKPGGHLIAPYMADLQKKTIEAIREALKNAAPSVLDWRYGSCDLATNRDLPMNEEQRFVVGFNPQHIADHSLLVGRISDAEGNIKGSIVNYACHPTTLAWDNQLISPDYIGAMRELVENHTGGNVLFLQGASGELAPAEQYVGDTEISDTHGRRLGHAVLATLEAMGKPAETLKYSHIEESGAPLAIWRKQKNTPETHTEATLLNISFPLKELPSLDEIEADWLACGEPVQKERLWRKMGIRKTVGEGDTSSMLLWIWKIGNAYLAGQPNEAYSRYQQRVRESCDPLPVAVINIVNGYAGYLPPEGLYTDDMYAVWQTPFAPGSLEKLEQQTINALKQMIDKTPTPS